MEGSPSSTQALLSFRMELPERNGAVGHFPSNKPTALEIPAMGLPSRCAPSTQKDFPLQEDGFKGNPEDLLRVPRPFCREAGLAPEEARFPSSPGIRLYVPRGRPPARGFCFPSGQPGFELRELDENPARRLGRMETWL